jgi:hypothetical protein
MWKSIKLWDFKNSFNQIEWEAIINENSNNFKGEKHIFKNIFI